MAGRTEAGGSGGRWQGPPTSNMALRLGTLGTQQDWGKGEDCKHQEAPNHKTVGQEGAVLECKRAPQMRGQSPPCPPPPQTPTTTPLPQALSSFPGWSLPCRLSSFPGRPAGSNVSVPAHPPRGTRRESNPGPGPLGWLTEIPVALLGGLLGEDPRRVGGIEGGAVGRVGMLLAEEFAEGALHRLVLLHAAQVWGWGAAPGRDPAPLALPAARWVSPGRATRPWPRRPTGAAGARLDSPLLAGKCNASYLAR